MVRERLTRQALTHLARMRQPVPSSSQCNIGHGGPIAEVSRQLGHNSITTTVDRYWHLVPRTARGRRPRPRNGTRPLA